MSGRARASIALAGFALAGLALALLGLWWTRAEPRSASPSHVGEQREAASTPARSRIDGRSSEPEASAREGASAGEGGRVSGRVIDSEEGPLGEGRVALDCPDGSALARVAIDEQGWFEGPACVGAPTCAALIHPGSEQTEAWQLVAGSSVEFEVEPAPRVAGIVEAEGRAIAAARVIARRGERRWTTSTDVDGRFALALGHVALAQADAGEARASACSFEPSRDDEPFTLLVLAPDHAPSSATIPAQGDEDISIALAGPAAPLTGRLIDPEDRGFARARVIATSVDRPDEAHAIVPDDAGEFAFTGLGEGVYRLRALRDGVELASGESEAGAKLVMRATRSARGPTLELELRDEQGLPLVDARVDGGPFQAARSDEYGRVLATDVFAGAYDLRLRPADAECGVSRERIEVPAEARGQTIRVDLSLGCEAEGS
ncbi:carboxypeptidase-like regulatory domain-containing protein [Nannocystaceae bacterium ST9]